MSGTVVTPGVEDRIGEYLTEGTEVVEIADLETLRARIYVSEYDMYKVREGAEARMQVEGVVEGLEVARYGDYSGLAEHRPCLEQRDEVQRAPSATILSGRASGSRNERTAETGDEGSGAGVWKEDEPGGADGGGTESGVGPEDLVKE